MVITGQNQKYFDRVKQSNSICLNSGGYSMKIDCNSSSREIYYVYRYQPSETSIVEKMYGNYRS